MISEEEKNNLLAKWLEGSLSSEQEEALRAQYDLDSLKKSVDHISKLSNPPYNPESEWNQLSKKLTNPENRDSRFSIGRRRLWIGMSIAAMIVLVVGSFFWLRMSPYVTISGLDKQVVEHILPDQSKITLSGIGSIKYNKKAWQANRIIELDGDAFFDVTSGNSFVVKAAYGEIEVLGTMFSIITDVDKNIVKCFEGRVQVTNPKETKIILEAGEGVLVNARNDLQAINTVLVTAPWMTNETKFNETDIHTVGQALEEVFAYEVILADNIKQNYSGVIIHNDLKSTLKLICDPLGLKYDINQKQIRIYK